MCQLTACRGLPPYLSSRKLPLIFQQEKGSALLVRIPSLWAESVPSPRCLCLAIWRGEANSFPQMVFLFSRACEFQQQWDSAPEHSRHPPRAFSLIATQIVRSILPQRALRPLAFLQASVSPERTSSRATRVCVALVSEILRQAVQKAAVFAWEPRFFFRGQRPLPAHAFSR